MTRVEGGQVVFSKFGFLGNLVARSENGCMQEHLLSSKPLAGPSVAGEVAITQHNCPWLRGKQEVAQHLAGISVKTVDAWVSRGLLSFTRLPGSRLMLFRRADVEKDMERINPKED